MIKGYGRKVRRSITKCMYTDEVAELIARRIRQKPEYKHYTVDAMGPFGLGAECMVAVKDGNEYIGSLTIRYAPSESGFGSFEYTDYNAPKKRAYPKGSIGDINGFNDVTRPLPTDIEEVIRLVFKD